MTTKTATPATPAPTNEKPTLIEKPVTDYHRAMARWMTERTGVTIDPQQVAIILNLRQPYVESPENRKRIADAAKAAQKKKAAALEAKKAKARAKIAALEALLAE